MQIALFSENESMRVLLSNEEKITNVITVSNLEKEIHCDALLLIGDVVPFNELKSYRDKFPDKKILYKIYGISDSPMIENITTVCETYDIYPLAELLTDEQVVKDTVKHLFGDPDKKAGNVIAFFGTHSGSGVSTTTMNVGKVLSQSVNDRVLVLSLNVWDPADYFLPYEGKYLDDIRIELKDDGLFTEESLMEAVHKYDDNFYHLAGNRNIKLQRFYKVGEFSRLIELARMVFDVVLIDGGSHFDNAAYAQSFRAANYKFLVTTQEEKGYKNYFPYVYNQLIKPLSKSKSEYMLLINRYESDLSLIKERELSEELGMSLLTSIPNKQIFGNIAVTQKKLLVDLVEGDYKESIKLIVNSIINRMKMNVKSGIDTDIKRKKLFGLIPVK
ncbi:ParA family protein [Fictibacillus sp. KIGAM418]|uniref:ParA family protein n=1 Tax=Fictibacillus marinisediminis TaxID=2878389 RepID=A0A9X1XGQ4_9BACL|nr:ParA family protein [Fictibacillus marinisediminis]MCK6259595.1 ParA family protein [Fictibacillus marinisediminis]